jgi:hypothetical protein
LNPIKENKILKKSKENPNNNYLGPSFIKLLDHLWKSNKKEYCPNEIHNDLKKLMLNNYNSKDISKIINYIFTKLHEEINFNPVNNNNINNDPYEHYNEDKSFKEFQNNFMQNRTTISDYCYSSIIIKKKCINCEATSYFFEALPVITVFLKENENEEFNKLNLENHLKTFLTAEEEENINENCIICTSEQKKFISKDLYSSSAVLIININRDKDPNNAVSFEYPEEFDGKKVINEKINLPIYELTTVIKKSNNNNNFNNFEYKCFYKSFIDKKWYSFNNQRIESIENNNKNNILDCKNICGLIYENKLAFDNDN